MLVLNYTACELGVANVNIRQAVARAINREAIVKNVYYGLVQPITIPMPPRIPPTMRRSRRSGISTCAAAATFVKKSGSATQPSSCAPACNDPDGQKIAKSSRRDLAKIGVTADSS